jgi:hypothetical protein
MNGENVHINKESPAIMILTILKQENSQKLTIC